MTALRAEPAVAMQPYHLAPRWILVPATAALILAGAWWFIQSRADAAAANSLATGAAVLEIGGQLQPAIESATVLSLSTELERFHRDLDEMTQFVIASLP